MKKSDWSLIEVVISVGAFLTVACIFWLFFAVPCALVELTTDVTTKWRPVVGCMVDVKGDGHFVPYDRWRAVE